MLCSSRFFASMFYADGVSMIWVPVLKIPSYSQKEEPPVSLFFRCCKSKSSHLIMGTVISPCCNCVLARLAY